MMVVCISCAVVTGVRRDRVGAHGQLAAHVRDGAARDAGLAGGRGAAPAPARGAHRAAAAAGGAVRARARAAAHAAHAARPAARRAPTPRPAVPRRRRAAPRRRQGNAPTLSRRSPHPTHNRNTTLT